MKSLRCVDAAAAAVFLLLLPTLLLSQTANPSNQGGQQTAPPGNPAAPPPQTNAGGPAQSQAPLPAAPAPAPSDQPAAPAQGQQTPRILWIAPNFSAVSANTTLPPLTARGKFHLAMNDSVDYSSFIWAGMLAGQGMALKSDPELGHGAAGYGRYYWRAFADQASGAFFTEALVPALTHEDPRYYTLGHGSYFRRTIYALSQVVLTKTDSGGKSFNFAEILGDGLEAGLANLYYPPQDRGLSKTANSWGVGIESAAANNLLKEFWPDIHNELVTRLKLKR